MSPLLTVTVLVTLILHSQGQICYEVVGSGCSSSATYLNLGQPTQCDDETTLGSEPVFTGSVLCSLDAPAVEFALQPSECQANVGDQQTCASWLSSCCLAVGGTDSPTFAPIAAPPTPPPIPGCLQLGTIPGAPDYSAVFDTDCDLDFNFANCSYDNGKDKFLPSNKLNLCFIKVPVATRWEKTLVLIHRAPSLIQLQRLVWNAISTQLC